MTPRALLLALPLLGITACHEDSISADFTGLNVHTSFAGTLPVAALVVSGTLEGGEAAFTTGTFELEPLSAPVTRRATDLFVGPLPPELAGERVRVEVEGRDTGGLSLGKGADDVTLILGLVPTASISLDPPSACGDGVISTAEACDDGNGAPGDGCDPSCTVEAGFSCALEPSRCFDRASAVWVDPAASCATGDGSEARPFCSLHEAANTPRAATVVARRGLYRGQVTLDRVRATVLAEPGAVVESDLAPAVHVLGSSLVELHGLVIRGASTGGGGVLVEGDARLTLDASEVGPSAEVGVIVRDRARLLLSRTIVRGNAAGGLDVASDADQLVENSVIAQNGAAGTLTGAARIRRAGAGTRISSSTITGNTTTATTAAGHAAGVWCEAPIAVHNSIVWSNDGGLPISENCAAGYSDLGPYSTEPGPLGSNLSEDPLLLGDFHLDPSSPCRDAGDPTGVAPAGVAPPIDLDGEARPKGARVDIGADEVG